MDRVVFEKYNPNEKEVSVKPVNIVIPLWLVSIIIFLLTRIGSSGPLGGFAIGYFICLAAVSVYLLVSSSVTYTSSHGFIDGTIIFDENGITVNDRSFLLSEIRNLEFCFIDYYGKPKPYKNWSVEPTPGVENYVSFDDRSGQKKMAYFKLMNKHSSSTLYPFINAAVKAGAISYLRAIDIIGVENVDKP